MKYLSSHYHIPEFEIIKYQLKKIMTCGINPCIKKSFFEKMTNEDVRMLKYRQDVGERILQ